MFKNILKWFLHCKASKTASVFVRFFLPPWAFTLQPKEGRSQKNIEFQYVIIPKSICTGLKNWETKEKSGVSQRKTRWLWSTVLECRGNSNYVVISLVWLFLNYFMSNFESPSVKETLPLALCWCQSKKWPGSHSFTFSFLAKSNLSIVTNEELK